MRTLYSLILALFVVIIPYSVSAQDNEDDVDRPKDIGASDFDRFKNSSFDVKDESASLLVNVTKLDNEVKKYSGVMNTIGVAKLKADFKAVKESQKAVKVLNEKLRILDDEGKTMVENAKNVKPKTKSFGAIRNSNTSIKGLNLAKNDLATLTVLLEKNYKLLSDELKSRGEPIE